MSKEESSTVGTLIGVALVAGLIGYFIGKPNSPQQETNNEPEETEQAVETATPEEPAFLKEGLVAYYPFNGNAKDESGNGNDGEVKGATPAEDRHGKDEKAYVFDGEDDFIEIVDSDNLRTPYITVTAWLKTNKDGTIVSKGNRVSSSGEQYFLGYHDRQGGPKIDFSIKRNSAGRAGYGWKRVLSDGAVSKTISGKGWVMVSATWDGEVQIVYLNGIKIARSTDAPHGKQMTSMEVH